MRGGPPRRLHTRGNTAIYDRSANCYQFCGGELVEFLYEQRALKVSALVRAAQLSLEAVDLALVARAGALVEVLRVAGDRLLLLTGLQFSLETPHRLHRVRTHV